MKVRQSLRNELNPDTQAMYEMLETMPLDQREHGYATQMDVVCCNKRFILMSGGEQTGKSLTAANILLDRMWDVPEPSLFWLVASDYDGNRRVFDYVRDGLERMGLLQYASKRVDPGVILVRSQDPTNPKPGVRIETKSAADPRKMRMFAPHGIVADEASQLDLEIFNRMMTRVMPKRGWLVLSGTMEGSLGWFPGLVDAWAYGTEDAQSFKVPSWLNTMLYPGGRNDPEILRFERESGDDYFMERMAGVPRPPSGRVFPEFRPDVHIQDVEWEPGEPVYLWEDPGYGGGSAHAIEFAQVINGQIRVFDEIYVRGLIQKEVIYLVMKQPWWADGAGRVLVSDPHYKDQHHSMDSVSEVWMDEAGLYAGGKKIRILEGVERMKAFLKPDPLTGVPGIIWSPRCRGILSEFGAMPHPIAPYEGQTKLYRWKTDRDGNVVGEIPEDSNNHGIKACIYGMVEKFGYGLSRSKTVIPVKRWGPPGRGKSELIGAK